LPVADCGLEKISSTLRLTITHKYQEAGIPLIFRKKRLRKSHAKNLQSKVGEAYATTLG